MPGVLGFEVQGSKQGRPQGVQFTVAPPQHFLYFFPEPQGHGSFRPTLGAVRRGSVVCTLGATRRLPPENSLLPLPYSGDDTAVALDFSAMAGYRRCAVKKLPEVEEAKALMIEAVDWSVFRWLFERRRVRETADRANAALDKLNQSVKSRWNRDVKAAYKELVAKAGGTRQGESAQDIDPQVRLFAQKVKEADGAANRARMAAEGTFEEAERQMNADLLREGCRKAILSWGLHERAIRRAEAVHGCNKATV